MKKILVPVDFSEVSKYAADFAVDLAERSGAEVLFLHSMHFNYYNDFPHATGINIQSMMDDVRDSVEKSIEEFKAGLKTDAKVESRISQLHLVESIKDIVDEEDIGLVIMGTAGSSGWSEVLVGSHTERIVRWAKCPVISVPGKCTWADIERILVPIDLREIQEEFMEKLVKLQTLFSAHMEFLWVKTPHNIENNERVIEEFSKLLKRFEFGERTSFTIGHNVFPSDGIMETAKDLKADMVAMATHARRGISHWLSGSITEDTVNHIKVPVWSFKLDKKGKNIELLSVKDAKGTPEYKKIEMMEF